MTKENDDERKEKGWSPFRDLTKPLEDTGFFGGGTSQSISIRQGPEGTRIDVSGDVDVEKLKEKYGSDAKIYKDGKRVDKPLIEVVEEDEEDEDKS